MSELEIDRQKAAQLMAFALGMVENGKIENIPENATSEEKYAIRNANVAKLMQKLVHDAKEYELTFTGDIDTWSKADFAKKQGMPTEAEKQGAHLGKTLAGIVKDQLGTKAIPIKAIKGKDR